MKVNVLSMLWQQKAADMTFREHLIAQAHGSILAHGGPGASEVHTAERAIAFADALLLQLAKEIEKAAPPDAE